MGTRIEQLEKQVEVLREALCDSGSESASRALYAADRIDDEPVEATVPAPTWRPIAEMPKEWRDGRLVLCTLPPDEFDGCEVDPMALRYDTSAWFDDTGTDRDPVLYLDLTIPEAPHG